MNALATLAAVNASLTLAETLIPRIAELVTAGEVTKEQQAEVLARYKALRDSTDQHFAGAEWQVD